MITNRDYPTNPAQLTAEWLTARLRAARLLDAAVVTGFSTVPVGEGIGMLGVIVRVARWWMGARHSSSAENH